MSAAAVQPWWRRRSVVTGAAAVLVLGMLWLAWRGISSGSSGESAGNHARTLSGTLKAAPAPDETFPPVTVTATLITLPEKAVFTRMLEYAPGPGDAALYRELLPQAEALQKLVKPEETFATTGHPLVVLSGSAKPKRMAQKAPSVPATSAPRLADPFAPSPPKVPPSIRLQNIRKFPYPTEWPYDSGTGRVTPSDPTFRNTGTTMEANVSPPDAGNLCLIECSVDHMFAPPETESWPYRWPDEKGASEDDAVQQPVFYSANWHLPPVSVPVGEIVLAGTLFLSADLLPDTDQEPMRLFLFLNIQP